MYSRLSIHQENFTIQWWDLSLSDIGQKHTRHFDRFDIQSVLTEVLLDSQRGHDCRVVGYHCVVEVHNADLYVQYTCS